MKIALLEAPTVTLTTTLGRNAVSPHNKRRIRNSYTLGR